MIGRTRADGITARAPAEIHGLLYTGEERPANFDFRESASLARARARFNARPFHYRVVEQKGRSPRR